MTNNSSRDRATLPERLILDHAPMLIGYVRADERYGYANNNYVGVFNREIHEVVGQLVRDVVGKAAYEKIRSYIRRGLQGEVVEFYEWITLPDGQVRFYHATYQPHHVDGIVRGFFIYGIDTTDKQRAEEARQESDNHFRAIFENAAVGMMRVGLDGRWLDVNSRLCDELGYSRQELLDRQFTFRDVTCPDDLEESEQQFAKLRRGDIDSFHMDKRYLRKDGNIVWGHVTVSTVRDDEGTPLYFVVVVENIAARKEAEDALQESKRMLEHRVEERTSELMNLNEELDAFNYSISHDLRAPLRGIDGFSQALLDDYGDEIDEVGRNYLERVREGAARMGERIDALLMISRTTRAEPKLQVVNLSEIAQEVALALQEQEPERNAVFQIRQDLVAHADRRLLRAVMSNLLENAWKFTRHNERTRIEVGSERQGNDTVYFVRDDGAGFDSRYADKLFVPFGRLHSPARFPGQGIGLSIVQRAIHRHGGRVWAESAVGEGATFFFTLPTSGRA